MIRINLLPTKAARRKETALTQMIVGAVVIAIAVTVCFIINSRMDSKVDGQRKEIADLNSKIAQLQSVIAEVESFKAKRKDLETKIRTIQELDQKRSGPVRFMEEFTYVLPRKAWIITFREVEKQLTLEGVAMDGATVSDFVDNLKSSKFFYNVQLIQVEQIASDGKKVQRFSVNCLVNYLAGEKI